MPQNEDEALIACISTLSNQNAKPTVIIVDALNQMDEDKAALLVNWVPKVLAPQIRCVFSMIPDTPQHKALSSRDHQPKMINLEPLDLKARAVSRIS